jgi:dienelactone hydrolase
MGLARSTWILLVALIAAPAAAPSARADGAPPGPGAPPAAAPAEAPPAPLTGRLRATPLAVEEIADASLRADVAAFAPTDGAETFEWTLAAPAEGAGAKGGAPSILRFPSPRPSGLPENDVVVCRWRAPAGLAPGARAPAAIILHHLAGADRLETMVADFLSRSGVAALEVDFPYYGARRPKDRRDVEKGLLRADFEDGIAASRQSVADVRRALDWLLSRPEVDPERVGIVGISLGAIQGSLVLGVEPRLRRNVLTLGGGDVASILTTESRETRKVRAVLAERGITKEDLARKLAPIEPLRYAARIDPRTVLMLNASEDEIIPKACTEALWRTIGEPEIHWYPTGHASIAGFLLELLGRMRDHFRAPAAPVAPPAPRRPSEAEVF